jgi:hypothetical protein
VTSKVDKKLCLRTGGRVVDVVGPVLWDDDEVSAVFSVSISQMDDDGNVRSAGGASVRYLNGNGVSQWTATAHTDEHAPLEPGPATAFATAVVEEQGGQVIETYTWTVLTRLRHCDDD